MHIYTLQNFSLWHHRCEIVIHLLLIYFIIGLGTWCTFRPIFSLERDGFPSQSARSLNADRLKISRKAHRIMLSPVLLLVPTKADCVNNWQHTSFFFFFYKEDSQYANCTYLFYNILSISALINHCLYLFDI